MKNKTLKELLYMGSTCRDKDAILEIIERFMPAIRKNARMLRCNGAESDLVIHLIEVIYSLKTEKIDMLVEGQAVNYIATAIRNKSVDINRKKEIDFVELESASYYDTAIDYEHRYEVNQLLSLLTERQKNIIVLKYYYGYSDKEIGAFFGISRQAVNKIHRVALRKMKSGIQK